MFVFVVFIMFVVFVVEDLGKVFEFIGVMCGSFVMFVILVLFLLYSKMRSSKVAADVEESVDDLFDGLDDVMREFLSFVCDFFE